MLKHQPKHPEESQEVGPMFTRGWELIAHETTIPNHAGSFTACGAEQNNLETLIGKKIEREGGDDHVGIPRLHVVVSHGSRPQVYG